MKNKKDSVDNKMDILLGNNTLALLAGSETWTFTLAKFLKLAGHKVSGFSPELGVISEDLKKIGVQCFNNVSSLESKPFSFIFEENVEHNYDVIIANHNHIVEYLRNTFQNKPIISTIHGIIHEMEDEKGKKVIAPEHPALNSGVNQFVSVSEEVRDVLKNKYNIDSIIIRNFFDEKKFNSKRKINTVPKQILINSNYVLKDDPIVEKWRMIAKHYGAKLIAIGYNFSPSIDPMQAIEEADIVVGMGRSVCEGVMAGRLGIVDGRWGTGGIICEKNINELRYFNFSGRNSNGVSLNVDELIKEIDTHYNLNTIDWGKKYMRLEHNASIAVESYIRLARTLLGQDINTKRSSDLKPYRRARDVAKEQ